MKKVFCELDDNQELRISRTRLSKLDLRLLGKVEDGGRKLNLFGLWLWLVWLICDRTLLLDRCVLLLDDACRARSSEIGVVSKNGTKLNLPLSRFTSSRFFSSFQIFPFFFLSDRFFSSRYSMASCVYELPTCSWYILVFPLKLALCFHFFLPVFSNFRVLLCDFE